jgi:hypothetical protein
MWNNKLKFATLTLGTVLTLAAPAIASARDRDDFRQRDDRKYSNSFRNRELELRREIERLRLERERLAQRWNRNRYNNNHQTYSNGYYDNAGHWHLDR